MINEPLLNECKSGNRQAQRAVYDYLAPKLYSTCKRYLKQNEEIEDVLSEAFVTIFTKMHTLKAVEALVSWARKIAVNQCLQLLRKQVNFNLSLDDIKQEPAYDRSAHHEVEHKDLLQLLQFLPDGCRSIFNLFAIEGYAHKEIASMLDISEGTSKSQLNVAKNKLQHLVNAYYYQKSTNNGIAK
ncbi:RNA polymerase subunit sigma-24 [Taibaiella sp. KBW10]|uniref:RNA polymerase sigma factor n=1 Tax=Taibaiella sp. KBW10 TaxID=2153357 RepID=UPI000F5A6C41|nr:RNA polymerase sigma factor [Taibaiella sp. KBW10]RQO31634.1 RNA polymerase subunit sigma-24 [Taibaiella sp. KBW10]